MPAPLFSLLASSKILDECDFVSKILNFLHAIEGYKNNLHNASDHIRINLEQVSE